MPQWSFGFRGSHSLDASMAGPRTRCRSKTPDPGWRATKSPPPGRALKKAEADLKKRVARSATPQKRLTFSPTVTVTSIEAENPSPQATTAPGASLRPAMSVQAADEVIRDLVARLWDDFVKFDLGPFTSGECSGVFGKRGWCLHCVCIYIYIPYLACRLRRKMDLLLLHRVRAQKLHR